MNGRRMTDEASQASSPFVTGWLGKTAGLTLMTDDSDTVSMTDDTSSLVPPHNARIRRGTGSCALSVSESPAPTPRTPWTYDGPLTDRARLTACNRCRHVVLEAQVDGVIRATVDPLLLAPLAELRHLVTGGRTVRIWPDPHVGDDARVTFRDVVNIRAHPGRGLPVHQCDRQHGPPDLQLLTIPTRPDPEDLAW